MYGRMDVCICTDVSAQVLKPYCVYMLKSSLVYNDDYTRDYACIYDDQYTALLREILKNFVQKNRRIMVLATAGIFQQFR